MWCFTALTSLCLFVWDNSSHDASRTDEHRHKRERMDGGGGEINNEPWSMTWVLWKRWSPNVGGGAGVLLSVLQSQIRSWYSLQWRWQLLAYNRHQYPVFSPSTWLRKSQCDPPHPRPPQHLLCAMGSNSFRKKNCESCLNFFLCSRKSNVDSHRASNKPATPKWCTAYCVGTQQK